MSIADPPTPLAKLLGGTAIACTIVTLALDAAGMPPTTPLFTIGAIGAYLTLIPRSRRGGICLIVGAFASAIIMDRYKDRPRGLGFREVPAGLPPAASARPSAPSYPPFGLPA